MNQSNIEQALRISSLIKKYLKDELTAPELQELNLWLAEHPQDRKDLQKLVEKKLNDYDANAVAYDTVRPYTELMARIRVNEAHKNKTIPLKSIYRFSAAAAILILVSVGLFLVKEPAKPTAAAVAKRSKGVELTLANGKKIDLEAQQIGLIPSEGEAKITKENGELLSYQSAKETADTENLNTLAIPRGKQYQLILPDGSKVWLNAQSTLSFPSSFNKKERLVELSGEAYFEVNHFSAWPFKVKTQHQQVEVLGTKFNINTYMDDESSKTALISGSVRVSDKATTLLLKPGQLAEKFNNKQGFTITDADANEAIAWKNGKLLFKDETIENILQTLARTFDVDFQIDERIKGQHFSGTFAIKSGLTNTLRSLEQTGAIHFKAEGRRINAMP